MRSTRALAMGAVAVVAVGCGTGGPGADGAGAVQSPGACAATVHAELLGVAERIYAEAAGGPNVVSAVRRLGRSRRLAAAVAAGRPRAVRAALRPLLRDQIQRIAVFRGRRVLADLGSASALAPVDGVIRAAGGAPVGRFRLSVARDDDIARVVRAVTGAQVVMRSRGRTIVSTAPGLTRRVLPHAGSTASAATGTAVGSFGGRAFPRGALRISLLSGPPARGLCAKSPAATRVAAVGAVGRRVLADEERGAATARVLRIAARDPRLVAAVARDRPAALRAAIVGLFREPSLHVVRIRATTARGRLVGDVGGPHVIAPASAPVRAHGRVVGRVTLSVQDDAGYVKLVHRFTGAQVVLRTAAGTVPGSTLVPGPAVPPVRGQVRWRGTTYGVVSFPAPAFPAGRLGISVLVPLASAGPA